MENLVTRQRTERRGWRGRGLSFKSWLIDWKHLLHVTNTERNEMHGRENVRSEYFYAFANVMGSMLMFTATIFN